MNADNNSGKKKILIIDDDEIHLSMIGFIMAAHGYEVLTAASGKDAVGLLSKGIAPDLILLDIIMPDMDGWETYKNLRAIEHINSVPIAFFTSSNEPEQKERAFAMGAADYIIKPFKKDELLLRVEKLI